MRAPTPCPRPWHPTCSTPRRSLHAIHALSCPLAAKQRLLLQSQDMLGSSLYYLAYLMDDEELQLHG